ncbi:ATP12 family chaperone protein [Jannaschia rubra]|uniref:ATP12 chaperone protein n=1 Tax=Jannaschia rubra TaxID=282197 RepID=A0A0M6XML5_9RHOB|nr:ATP12 family protein [Jannaschia rubra]CTQ32319.1 ATP12 chaperone protein [Jannaschia rubra]SFG47222.1 Chaperone required for the assembly of the F1-ATPase [Jannaschia rubra]
MSEWKAKKFWKNVTVEPLDEGFTVRLDGRAVRTPAKTEVRMPTEALARGVADEWRAQGQLVDPLSMPLMRAVNATLDKVIPQRAEVAAGLAEYGGSDLLSYRATSPDGLIARQASQWNPMLDWAETQLGARLATTQGVIPVPQPETALAALTARVESLSPWELTALSELVSLSGSLVLGLAVLEGQPAERMWTLSRLDEDWQAEQWGVDEEEADRIARKREAFLQAERYLSLVRDRCDV